MGVDGQEGGPDALALARALRVQIGDLTLAYVFNGWEAVSQGSDADPDAAQRFSLDVLEKARDRGGSLHPGAFVITPAGGDRGELRTGGRE